MRHLIFYIVTLLMLPLAGSALAQGNNLPTSDSTQVKAVMNQYFTALGSGDVGNLKMLLGGKLKAKRAALLNNPEYAGYLATTYMNASFSILGIHSIAPNTVSVDALISFGQDETIRKLYTLKRGSGSKAGAVGGNTTTAPYQIISEAVSTN